MIISKLRVAPESLGSTMLLTGVRAYKEYKDGQPIGDIAGYRYEVCLVSHQLDKISVKIAGKQLMDAPENGAIEVRFEGLEVGIYQSERGIGFTAKATGISAVNAESGKAHR